MAEKTFRQELVEIINEAETCARLHSHDDDLANRLDAIYLRLRSGELVDAEAVARAKMREERLEQRRTELAMEKMQLERQLIDMQRRLSEEQERADFLGRRNAELDRIQGDFEGVRVDLRLHQRMLADAIAQRDSKPENFVDEVIREIVKRTDDGAVRMPAESSGQDTKTDWAWPDGGHDWRLNATGGHKCRRCGAIAYGSVQVETCPGDYPAGRVATLEQVLEAADLVAEAEASAPLDEGTRYIIDPLPATAADYLDGFLERTNEMANRPQRQHQLQQSVWGPFCRACFAIEARGDCHPIKPGGADE